MIRVADEIWIATALLHREHPERYDFSTSEIIQRALQENLAGYRHGLGAHASAHCVATKPPSPARVRILTETGRGRRRLFRAGDPFNSGRKHGKTHPAKMDVPEKYAGLIDWYEQEYSEGNGKPPNQRRKRRRPRGKELLKFVGAIPPDELQRIAEAIQEGCERVDFSEW